MGEALGQERQSLWAGPRGSHSADRAGKRAAGEEGGR